MICDVIRIPLRKFIIKVTKIRNEVTTSDIIRSIAKDNEDMDIEDLGLLLIKVPTVRRVELTDWSLNGIMLERDT